MNRILIIITMSFVLMQSSFAQNISIEENNKIIDFSICKYVELSIGEDAKKEVKKSDFQAKCNCEENPSYKQILEAIPNDAKEAKSLADEINSERSYFNNKSKNEIIDLLSLNGNDNIPNFERFNFFIKKSRKNSLDCSYNKPFDDVKTSITNKKESSASISPNESDTNLTHQTEEPTKELEITEANDSWYDFSINIPSLLFIIIASAFIYFFQRKQNQDDIEYNGSKCDCNSDKFVKKDNLNNVVENLKCFKDLNTKITFITSVTSVEKNTEKLFLNNDQDKGIINNSTNNVSINNISAIKEKKYLKQPSGEGKFNDETTNSIENNSMYWLQQDGNKFTFHLIDDEKVRNKAKKEFDSYLGYVCECKDVPDDKKQLKLGAPGILKLEDNKWIVTTKAKISYV